ncbi:MAG: hypothetical protein V1792_06925 [Pseudomonadota bacterium]
MVIRPKKTLSAAYEFIKEWKAETPGPYHYLEVKCFGMSYQKVFIDPAFDHIERRRQRIKADPKNIARRYRLLPCVKDLLMNSEDTPEPTRDGNLFLVGKAPPYNELFRVILSSFPVTLAPGLEGYNLISFFPLT